MDKEWKIYLIPVLVLITTALFFWYDGFFWIIPLVLVVILLMVSVSNTGFQNNNSLSTTLRSVTSAFISLFLTGILMVAYGYFSTGDNLGGLALILLVPIFFPIIFLITKKFTFRLQLILFLLSSLPVIAFIILLYKFSTFLR